jgi:hypothetical protein
MVISGLVLVLELELVDFVFYSQFLSLEIGHRRGVRQRAAGFPDDFAFDHGMPGTERFDMILKHERLQS